MNNYNVNIYNQYNPKKDLQGVISLLLILVIEGLYKI